MPWHVARIGVGNTSPGSSQVVALGPNWPKKELRKYRACSRRKVSDEIKLPHGVPHLLDMWDAVETSSTLLMLTLVKLGPR